MAALWRYVFSSLALLWAGVVASASAPPLILSHLSTTDGLPQGNVMAIHEDQKGFMWLGTEDGLIRFDGRQLQRYAYSRTQSSSLPGNFINAISSNANGDLWVAVKGAGLARWDPHTDKFTVYRHADNNGNSIASDAVRALAVDGRGRVWVGLADAGVDVLDPATGHIEHIRHDNEQPNSLVDDRVQSLMLDRSGFVWISTNSGLDRLSSNNRSCLHVIHRLRAAVALRGEQVSQVIEDRSGEIWVGSFDAGLKRIDSAGTVLSVYQHQSINASSLASNDVRAILEDRAGNIWVGTAEGLDLLDRRNGTFQHFRYDKASPHGLPNSFVMSLYQDRHGLVWIGTRAGGVSWWNPRSWEFGSHRPDWLDGKLTTAFADADYNRLWIASVGGGLIQWDSVSGEHRDIDAIVGRRNALGDKRVMSLHRDRRGDLWIGTMDNSLKKLTAGGQLTSIPVRPGGAHALSASGIMTIYEARDGVLWIGTHGGGANTLDPNTGQTRQLPYGTKDDGAVSDPNVTSFTEDRAGFFWIGTDGGGLNLARADGQVIRVFRHDPDDATSLAANSVYSLVTDARGRVWIATDGGGLDQVMGSPQHPESIYFRNLSHAEGLSSDTVYGVLPDAAGRLWLSGNSGLTRFDPNSGAIKNFHQELGLQGEEFDSGAYFRSADGRLCFGGPGGFNSFDPLRVSENRRPPPVALTQLELLGAAMPSSTPYTLLDRIALKHTAAILSLDFAVLDFVAPQRNRLAYRMAGLSDTWIDLGNLHRVTLTNLEAGDHVLEVRAASADSDWSPTPLRLAIHKDPAPWLSLPAKVGYLLLLIGLATAALLTPRRNLQRAIAAQQRLESEVAARTRELVDTNRQLVEASEAKSSFLARMSHELRTPMNGVVGMTELLSRTELSSAQTRLIRTIGSSAQTLLKILSDLLDLSKIHAGKIELEVLPFELTPLVEDCVMLFAGSAESKGIELLVCPPAEDRWIVAGDALRIRQVLMNLIANALKFTAHGEVVVSIALTPVSADLVTVRIGVRDTGIGMEPATIARVFDPFTQADETTSRRFGGTGLGLSICRDLVTLMHGTIGVDSEPQVGSTFTVSLPLKLHTAKPDTTLTPIAGLRVRIETNRPTLAESLNRHLASLGCQSFHMQSAGAPQLYDVRVIDADTQPRQYDFDQAVVIASSVAISTWQLETRLPSERLVHKPVSRDALRDAVLAASNAHSGANPSLHTAPKAVCIDLGRVLIVEDNPVNAAVAEGYLTELGYASVWVTDGAAAIARYVEQRFDLILMDLNMPDMDGFAATSLIREHERAADGSLANARVPIVALTAHEADAYRDACLTAGMDDILSKPYKLADCARITREWIELRRQIDQRHAASINTKLPRGSSRISRVKLPRRD